ncbi:helix-turn-helix domain-containing protein [Pseudonocardia sp. DSM 110487]|nr:helix-turn-helix domain-containing protein [Pseudonocardia sp. DSM 110487]QYN34687.1 helix-turn-helix domain-containing protein [Pseudonocardia sp. DSM 110487]
MRFVPGLKPANPQTARFARLTVQDVCAELGISRSTFYEWRTKRRGPKCILASVRV